MKVLTHDEMREADRAAIAAGIPSLVLMENAAFGLLRAMEQRFAPLNTQRIAIFCGKGNNGGDGLALARLLHIHHRPSHLTVLLAFPPEDLSEDAAHQLRMLEALQVPYTMQVPQDLAATTLAVDALLGTGVRGALREPVADLVTLMNALPLARRIAVDIPTGGQVQADLTVTFAAPKPEHVLPPDCDQLGELVIVPIGIPDALLATTSLNVITAADLKLVGAPRQRDTHKGTYGHVAVLGGAQGKHGALHLAGEAAIRGGAGWVTLYSPDAGFQPAMPDLMRRDWPRSTSALEAYRVIAVGPGLGMSDEAEAIVGELYRNHPAAVVLDADALNLLAPLEQAQESDFPRVLTPHPGEMKRLVGRPVEDRCEDARLLAKRTKSTVVLKGHRTVVAFPDGQVWINPTGSPALAKAGSGDVLTGLIAALLSQFPTHADIAVLAAVYLHGRCGELADEKISLASRLCDHLAEAFRELA
jgi:hydroxyethylthiazole kinase-like uncharacterized protein yjeF